MGRKATATGCALVFWAGCRGEVASVSQRAAGDEVLGAPSAAQSDGGGGSGDGNSGEPQATCTAGSYCGIGEACLFPTGDCLAMGRCVSLSSLEPVCNTAITYCGCNGTTVSGVCGSGYSYGPTPDRHGPTVCDYTDGGEATDAANVAVDAGASTEPCTAFGGSCTTTEVGCAAVDYSLCGPQNPNGPYLYCCRNRTDSDASADASAE